MLAHGILQVGVVDHYHLTQFAMAGVSGEREAQEGFGAMGGFHAENLAAVHDLGFADGAEAVGVAGGEAEHAHVVVQGGAGEVQDGWGEEHGFVIGVGDEQEDG